MQSYWKLDRFTQESTQETLDFIKEQADLLAKDTNGKVQAHFIPERHPVQTSVRSVVGSLAKNHILPGVFTKNPQTGKTLRSLLPQYDSQTPPVKSSAQNAATLYQKKIYEFYITGGDYELAVFILRCGEEYPVELLVDESVAENTGMEKSYVVKSSEQFKRYFARMLESDIVTYVIRKLWKMAG